MKVCSHCRTEKPLKSFGKRAKATDGLHPWCRACVHDGQRAHYERNREKIKAERRRYRVENTEAVRASEMRSLKLHREAKYARNRAYHAENSERLNAESAEWRRQHPEASLEHWRRYRESHREKRRASGRRYYAEQPLEVKRAKAVRNTQRRKARKRAATIVPFTAAQLELKMTYWGNRCYLCGGPREAIDHVKPLSKGGPHALANFRPICNDCNGRKANHWPFPTAVREAV